MFSIEYLSAVIKERAGCSTFISIYRKRSLARTHACSHAQTHKHTRTHARTHPIRETLQTFPFLGEDSVFSPFPSNKFRHFYFRVAIVFLFNLARKELVLTLNKGSPAAFYIFRYIYWPTLNTVSNIPGY